MSQPSLLEHSQGMGELQLHCPIGWMSNGYGSIPINTIFRGMNIHLPAILMWTTGVQDFDTLSNIKNLKPSIWWKECYTAAPLNSCWVLLVYKENVSMPAASHMESSFHCTSACETIIWIQYQWFGLRENLQETIHFPISMEFSCKCQSLNQSIDSRWEFQTLTWLQNVDHVCRCLLYPSTDSCLTPAVHPAFFHSCQWKSIVSAGDVSNIVEHVFQFFVILHQPWSNDHYKYYNHL